MAYKKKQASGSEQKKVDEPVDGGLGEEHHELDDWLIKTYLLRKGETIEEAKRRLSKN